MPPQPQKAQWSDKPPTFGAQAGGGQWSDKPPGYVAPTSDSGSTAPTGTPGVLGFVKGVGKGILGTVGVPAAELAPISPGLRSSILGRLEPHGTAETAGSLAPLAATAVYDPAATFLGLAGGAAGAPIGYYAAKALGASPEKGEAAGAMLGSFGGMTGGEKLPASATGFAVRHPEAVELGAGAAGGALGGMTGEHFGGGYGGLGGGGFGIWEGMRAGRAISRAADDKFINDVIEGRRPFESTPPRLMPRLRSQMDAMRRIYAERAAETGAPIEELRVPTGLRESVAKTYEERAREAANLPKAVLTPEEYRDIQRSQAAYEAMKKGLKGEASLRGTAYAAGRHSTEWVPSKRGITSKLTRSSKILPKLPER